MPDVASAVRPVVAGRPHDPAVVERGTLAAVAVAVSLVLAAQVPLALGLLDPDVAFEAGHAKRVLAVNALVAAITVAGAAVLPARRRALALLPGGLLAGTMLGAAITVGGHLWDMAMAVFGVMGAWWLGRLTMRVLRVPRLHGVFVVELVVGLGWAGLVVLVLGRLDALAWWSVGALSIAVGAIGAWTAAREAWPRRSEACTAVTGTRIGTACAGLLMLQLAWAIVWLSAPEIMYDALYGKAYLPELWASTGSIGPLLVHPVLNVAGLASVVAVPGHAVGAPDVGRWLQLLAWVALVATTWWWAGRRSAAGPLAALIVGVVPQLVWQSATAFDDLVLTLGAVALTIAVLRTAGRSAGEPALGTAIAIGLLAGACVWLKLNLLSITAVLALGWVLLAGAPCGLLRRGGGVLLGALAIAGPSFALRWLDTGNPVFPSYNTLFKSSHYPLVDERYNFPFWPQAGFWDAVKAPYEAVVHPFLMNEAAPEGAFGLLVAAVVLGVLLGWRQRERRAGLIVWAAIVVSLLLWWSQFRYLRYMVPTAMACTMLVLAQLRGWRPGRAGAAAMLLAAGLASIFYLPSTVASFWNVPHRDLPFAAAFGRWDREDYLRTVFPEKDALQAYRRLAPVGADAISDAHERVFVVGWELSPSWEVARLMQLYGPDPTAPDDTFRRLRRLGIGWAIVSGINRTPNGVAWIHGLLAAHGTLMFGDRGWDVYRLDERPMRPRLLAACDERLAGSPRCWTGHFDKAPGLSDGESPGGASRSVPACPGQTVAVQLTTAPSGQDAQVALNSDSGDAKAGHSGGAVPPGTTAWIYGTAPARTRTTTVTIVPGVGGAIERVRLGLLGPCRSDTR